MENFKGKIELQVLSNEKSQWLGMTCDLLNLSTALLAGTGKVL
jgi:hypothetical protein